MGIHVRTMSRMRCGLAMAVRPARADRTNGGARNDLDAANLVLFVYSVKLRRISLLSLSPRRLDRYGWPIAPKFGGPLKGVGKL